MTCRQLTDDLLDFVAEELAAERRGLVQLHLDGCPACVALVYSYRVVAEVARRLPPPEPPPALLTRLAELARPSPSPEWGQRGAES